MPRRIHVDHITNCFLRTDVCKTLWATLSTVLVHKPDTDGLWVVEGELMCRLVVYKISKPKGYNQEQYDTNFLGVAQGR